ncbi:MULTISPECIES: DUF4399 domain-containing protein [Halomonadaceae]|uniref:DUF4399 domain-containing protein n=1 Tax=Vreelandella titanicae TaxID=664683 RepID=A0AAP9NND7_9GAMM|nr:MULTISPECIES: DUF4399 domain-containing protein [Halomonas]QKS25543.1 hypothetical protein FX987_03339 [Halomonas titanicae]CDG53259.1 conserved exported hypothetical protein [Halomonas sp. A3H3]
MNTVKHAAGRWLVALSLALLAMPAIAKEGVSFVTPEDGAEVSNPIQVEMGVSGMQVEPAGTMEESTGHHHLIVDGGSIAKGEVVPADDTHIHFGGGQTSYELTLPPGEHTLTLQFADGEHRSYGADWASTITVDVVE